MSAPDGVFTAVLYKETILVVRHKYGMQGLSLPGGGVNEGETLVRAAQRELKEETGLVARLSELRQIARLKSRKGNTDIHLFLHTRKDSPKGLIQQDLEEIDQVLMMRLEEVYKHSDVFGPQKRMTAIAWLVREGKIALPFGSPIEEWQSGPFAYDSVRIVMGQKEV
jgi:ADP-ribose pyrophosphatase YjhB (NUDIX family)